MNGPVLQASTKVATREYVRMCFTKRKACFPTKKYDLRLKRRIEAC